MAEKPYNSKNLEAIRKKINALDDRIHDTLMERAELVLQIGEEKRKNNIQVVQPAREARMIRRLLGRHHGALPQMAVVRIWRELVGAVSLLQTGLKVVVAVPEGEHSYWDLARDYFGSCLPMHKVKSALLAVSDVRENKATFAVVPWPQDEENPWWAFLADESEEPMRVSVRLPHGDEPGDLDPQQRALVVSKTGFDESGQDRSFFLVQCSSGVSRGKIVDVAEKMDLGPRSIASKQTGGPTTQLSVHLVEVDGYQMGAEDTLKSFAEKLDDADARCLCVGGYPVPPVYEKSVSPQKAAAE